MGKYDFPGCERGRPDRDTLSGAFGLRVPERFVLLVQSIFDVAGDAKGAFTLYERLLGIMPGGAVHRHPDLTPPEMFPIGATGGDGEHYGYVIHAPELGWDDYPLASLVPGEGDGAVPIGDDTFDAVSNLVAYQHGERSLEADELQVLERLGLAFDPARADRVRPLVDGAYARMAPAFPDGWRHVMMFDRVGVAAPAQLFGDDPLEALAREAPPRAYLERAEAARARGCTAAALFYLKLGRDGAQPDHDYATLLDRLWKTYRALGRGAIGPG